MPEPASRAPDLAAAGAAVDLTRSVIDAAARRLARLGPAVVDTHQVVCYDLAHSAAAIETARAALAYGRHGPVEASLATAFAADAVWDLATRLLGREDQWGAGPQRPRPRRRLRGHAPGPGLAGVSIG